MSARQNYRLILLGIMLVFSAYGCAGPETATEHFAVSINTPQQEADYTCHLIEGITYYTSRGYTPELPEHPYVDALLQDVSQGSFDQAQCETLDSLFEEELYQARLYTRPYHKVLQALPVLEQAYEAFNHYNQAWGFDVFVTYQILLTLYGPGGTFDSQTGTIWLMITDAGSFKMGDDPAMVITHEAVHIGIDGPIVQRFGLDQPVTERIVDRFVTDHYQALLPDYRMQALGEASIDPYLNHPDSWERLPEYIAQYAKDR